MMWKERRRREVRARGAPHGVLRAVVLAVADRKFHEFILHQLAVRHGVRRAHALMLVADTVEHREEQDYLIVFAGSRLLFLGLHRLGAHSRG